MKWNDDVIAQNQLALLIEAIRFIYDSRQRFSAPLRKVGVNSSAFARTACTRNFSRRIDDSASGKSACTCALPCSRSRFRFFLFAFRETRLRGLAFIGPHHRTLARDFRGELPSRVRVASRIGARGVVVVSPRTRLAKNPPRVLRRFFRTRERHARPRCRAKLARQIEGRIRRSCLGERDTKPGRIAYSWFFYPRPRVTCERGLHACDSANEWSVRHEGRRCSV